ncbi:hypothetical protein BJ742DRAFT_808574 [Cladochytrium replicatum]|nr:hypothetical protein BJ742DRAFT_808574 [Cladochytrium replicatum]
MLFKKDRMERIATVTVTIQSISPLNYADTKRVRLEVPFDIKHGDFASAALAKLELGGAPLESAFPCIPHQCGCWAVHFWMIAILRCFGLQVTHPCGMAGARDLQLISSKTGTCPAYCREMDVFWDQQCLNDAQNWRGVSSTGCSRAVIL